MRVRATDNRDAIHRIVNGEGRVTYIPDSTKATSAQLEDAERQSRALQLEQLALQTASHREEPRRRDIEQAIRACGIGAPISKVLAAAKDISSYVADGTVPPAANGTSVH
jgi:hypothetical protein